MYLSAGLVLCPPERNPDQEKTRVVTESLLIDAVRLLEAGDVKGAETRLDIILKMEPANDAACYYKARCAGRRKDVETAGKYFLKAAQADTTNLWYRSTLAEFYESVGRRSESSAIYLNLLKTHPEKFSNAYTYTLLADSQLSQRQDSLALVNYGNALLYDPFYAPALLGKAETYRMKGNFPAFFSTIDSFARDSGIVPKAKCEYVKALLNHVDGRFFRSWNVQLDSLVGACVSAHPCDSSALSLAGSWYYATGRKDMAAKYFKRYEEAYPTSSSPFFIRIQMLSEDRKYAEMISECDRILAQEGLQKKDKLSALSIKGDTYYLMNERRKAYAAYDAALKEDPGYVPVLNNYAYYLSMEKRSLRKAEKMSRLTVEKNPDNPTYLDTYGWILHLMGKSAEAKPYFKHALIYGGNSSDVILMHYSEVLRALGDAKLADYYKNLSESKKK